MKKDSTLGLMSLETCTVRGYLTEVFKLSNGGNAIDTDIFLEYDRSKGNRRGHSEIEIVQMTK